MLSNHTHTHQAHIRGTLKKKQTVIDSVPYLVYLRVSRGLLTPRPCKNGSASHTWTSDLKQQTPKAMAKMSLWIRSKFLKPPDADIGNLVSLVLVRLF